MAAYPSGFQPYRNSHFNYDEWVAAGYDRAFIEDYLVVERRQLQPPERGHRAAHPRHLPVLLGRRGRTGQGPCRPGASAQETADAIAAAWEKITDQIGRDSQIELYKASLGL